MNIYKTLNKKKYWKWGTVQLPLSWFFQVKQLCYSCSSVKRELNKKGILLNDRINGWMKNSRTKLMNWYKFGKKRYLVFAYWVHFCACQFRPKFPLPILNTVIDQFSLLNIFFARFFVSFSSISVNLWNTLLRFFFYKIDVIMLLFSHPKYWNFKHCWIRELKR